MYSDRLLLSQDKNFSLVCQSNTQSIDQIIDLPNQLIKYLIYPVINEIIDYYLFDNRNNNQLVKTYFFGCSQLLIVINDQIQKMIIARSYRNCWGSNP